MCGSMISSQTLKARKNHCCAACRVPIPSGFSYVRVVETDDVAKIFVTKWHVECRAEFDKMLSESFDDCGDAWDTWENGDMPPDIRQRYMQLEEMRKL